MSILMSRIISVVCLFFLLQNASGAATLVPPEPHAHPELEAVVQQFKTPQLIKVSERVYMALAYDFANFAFIIGDDGIIVFDAGWKQEGAEAALKELRKITDKPVVAMIYSHGHMDHTGGVGAFIEPGQEKAIPIFAHENWERYRSEISTAKTPIVNRRMLYQLGSLLPERPDGSIGSPSGAKPVAGGTMRYIPPNRTVEEKLETTLAGVDMTLFHAPGDLDDGLALWLPDEKVLLAGDAIYHVMPAVATPRFEKGRDALAHAETLEKFMQYPAEHIVPGHGPEISGRENIQERLRDARDTILFVRDQTIRLINQNKTREEVAAELKLPPHLANDPFLQEHYHRLGWIVKGVYTKEAGWYGGEPMELINLPPKQQAQNIIALAGGEAAVLGKAEAAYDKGNFVWAAQLVTYIMQINPNHVQARKIKAYSLRQIAYNSISGNERQYLLTEAMVLEGAIDPNNIPKGTVASETLRMIPNARLLRDLGVKLDPKKSQDILMAIGIDIIDQNETHTLIVRRGVLDSTTGLQPGLAAQIALKQDTFWHIMAGKLDWAEGIDRGLIQIKHGKSRFREFLALMDS